MQYTILDIATTISMCVVHACAKMRCMAAYEEGELGKARVAKKQRVGES